MIRVAVISLVIGACVAGAALAQQSTFTPRWRSQPEGRHFARNYPNEALENGTPGAVVLCCAPRANGRLNCVARREWPAGAGFAAASVHVAREYRLTQASYAAYQASARRPIQQVMYWETPPLTQQWVDYKAEFRRSSENACTQ